jgi:hypothetical protein
MYGYIVSMVNEDEYGALVDIKLRGESIEPREKPVPMTLRPLQISHWLAWDGYRHHHS